MSDKDNELTGNVGGVSRTGSVAGKDSNNTDIKGKVGGETQTARVNGTARAPVGGQGAIGRVGRKGP